MLLRLLTTEMTKMRFSCHFFLLYFSKVKAGLMTAKRFSVNLDESMYLIYECIVYFAVLFCKVPIRFIDSVNATRHSFGFH